MKYRYGYVKQADSPRLTQKSPTLRAIERKQAAVANEGTIECWFTAQELGVREPPTVYPKQTNIRWWLPKARRASDSPWVH